MDRTFDQWMKAVDEACYRLAGLSIHDLPDQSFRDCYDAGESPDEFTREVLEDEGFPFEDAA